MLDGGVVLVECLAILKQSESGVVLAHLQAALSLIEIVVESLPACVGSDGFGLHSLCMRRHGKQEEQ